MFTQIDYCTIGKRLLLALKQPGRSSLGFNKNPTRYLDFIRFAQLSIFWTEIHCHRNFLFLGCLIVMFVENPKIISIPTQNTMALAFWSEWKRRPFTSALSWNFLFRIELLTYFIRAQLTWIKWDLYGVVCCLQVACTLDGFLRLCCRFLVFSTIWKLALYINEVLYGYQKSHFGMKMPSYF